MAEPTPRYHINVFYSPEDECWVADAPDLKYCSAFGHTAAEAVIEIQIAMEAWLEVWAESGRPLPEAKYKPLIYQIAG